MIDRRFTAVELRAMLEDATGHRPDIVSGRWIIEARLHGARWEIIVEPDAASMLIVVITASAVDR